MRRAVNRIEAQITGETRYIDDLERPGNMLFGFIVKSPVACGKIKKINIQKAEQVSDVCSILSYKDIPGKNYMGAVFDDEPILAQDKVEYIGQAILLIAAKTKKAAKEAAGMIEIEIEETIPVLDVEKSFNLGNFLFNPLHIERGDVERGFAESDHVLEGELIIGGQEHFYLETQAALAIPGQLGVLNIRSSTQNPSENQLIISKALDIEYSKVQVEAGTLGGGFGGKETQSNWCAVWSALLAYHCRKPVLMVLDRSEDMLMTGKRHPVKVNYKIGFNKNGVLNAYSSRFLLDTGYCSDLSRAIIERCMLHLDNAYYIKAVKSDLYPCRTNKASNTAFRGFGAPQGIAAVENIMDEISKVTGIDGAIVRRRNFYGKRVRKTTPYGQTVKGNPLDDIYAKLLISSDYKNRVRLLKTFNKKSDFIKRGIAMVPVKFGISFTTSFLNQGSALVNLYKDGSATVHHGGVEMGQGLHDKMIRIVSGELGLPPESVRICDTDTSVIANTSATAASTGSDINGHAIKLALDRLKKRLNSFAAQCYNLSKGTIVWEGGSIYEKENPDQKYPLAELLANAHTARINLSEQAFYKTPGVWFDREKSVGNPFYYYACGLSVSEVEVDMLTGEHSVLRTDILHDAGESLDKVIDRGQIAGAFVQCMGWTTLEELVYNNKGLLLTSSADTYKIPGIADIPKDFRIELYDGNPFKDGILKSRAIGEPPFIYGLSVWLAIKNALRYFNCANYSFDLPATKEIILKCASYVECKQKD